MKSSKNFNVRSAGSDYTKQRQVIIPNDVREQDHSEKQYRSNEIQNEMVYVRRPTKKINNRFQK